MDKVIESRINEVDREILDFLVPTLTCGEIGNFINMMKSDDLKSYVDDLHYRHCPER